MRIAHLADLHLGYRAYNRTAPNGLNQREVDVALAFERVIDRVLRAQPDVVLIAGDVFHSVRPTNTAIVTCFAQLQRIRVALPVARIVMVAGNHDTPRTSETGTILGLYRALGVDVALTAVARYNVDDVTITAVPSAAAQQVPAPVAERRNVLVMHGDVAGYGAPEGLAPAAFQGWEYVALGHYHVAAEVAPLVWYAGATDYTSSDPWAELREEYTRGLPGKGCLFVDLADRFVHRLHIEPPRRYVDLEPVDAYRLAATAVDHEIALRCYANGIDDAVVRLVVNNLTREMQRALDHAALRRYHDRALHFNLVARRPAAEQSTLESRAAHRRTLGEVLTGFLEERVLPPDVDRADLVQLGTHYLDEATREAGEEPHV